MKLRKTIEDMRSVYRVFEVAPKVFHVLDSDGRTVDKFVLVETEGGGGKLEVKREFRRKAHSPMVPSVVRAFASELNAERKRH